MPLTPIPLASESYRLASVAASSARLLNMYAEKLPENSRSPFILKPSPGLSLAFTVGAGPVLAMASVPGFLYVVSGSRFYRVTPDGTVTDLGDIGLSAAPSIALGADQAMVCSPPNAFICDHTGTLSQVTTGTGNFPAEGASSICWIDGYFVFTNFTGEYFFVSKLLDGSTYDSLDFAKSERRPDFVTKGIEHNGELWLFGQAASAVWYDSGAADFPFRERSGSVMRTGLGGALTLCVLDSSLFWLGNDRVVYRSSGYTAKRVSTHAIEEVLARAGDLTAITGASWMHDGHAFYALSLPDQTFVYDVSTGLWHERSSAGAGRWTISVAQPFGSRLLLASSVNGEVYDLDATIGTEDGIDIPRVAVLPLLVTHGPRAFMSRLEVEMETGTVGTPSAVTLDWSDDGGLNYGPARSLDTGGTRARVAATRLGSFRQRALRLQGAGRMTVYGVDVDVAEGAA